MSSSNKKSAFFHTLVVVGGGIVGCGGQAQDAASRGDGDGDATSSGGSVGDGDGDTQPGTGGMISIGTGGSPGDGDFITFTGGATGDGGAYMGGAHGLGCPPEQWACSDVPYNCNWQEDEILTSCTCDEAKPIAPSDCPAGTALTCMNGVEYDDAFNGRSQPFDCLCLEEQGNCSDQCEPRGGYPSDCFEPGTVADFEGYLCGCELPVLR